jgi:inner membrane protein
MPTILTHPAVPLALRRWFGELPAHATLAGVVLSILPDADVAGFGYGIEYGSLFGHRGFTHSIVFAAVTTIVAMLLLRTRSAAAAMFFFAAAISHPLLDAMTNGGRGIAFFSPFSNHRYFFPWRPIEVSPIGALDFSVLWNEVLWVWLPAAIAALAATKIAGRRR